VTDLPQRSSRHTTTTSSSRRSVASSNFSRSSRCYAPEPTFLICTATADPRLAA